MTTYYQVAPLNFGDDALFFWAVKKNKKWSLNSHLEKGLTFDEIFNFTYKSENEFNFFICPEFCIYGKLQTINWKRIDFAVDYKNYFRVYRRCEITHDSLKHCRSGNMNSTLYPEILELRIQMDSAIAIAQLSEQYQLTDSFQTLIDMKTREIIYRQGQKITLTLSDFIFKDLDTDGQDEIFWFSISDKSIIDFKVYHLTTIGLLEVDSKSYLSNLQATKEYDDLILISTLDAYEWVH